MRTLLSILLVLGILAAGATVAVVLRDSAQGRAGDAERDRAARASQELEKTLQETAFRVRGVAGLFESSDVVSSTEFDSFVKPLFAEQDALNAVIWMPRVTDRQRPAFERSRRFSITEGPPDARRTSAARAVYFPVAYLVTDTNRRALGFDAASDPARLATIRRATRLAEPESTAPVTLAGSGKPGVLIYQPVFDAHAVPATTAERDQKVQGVVAGSYRLDSLLAALRRSVPDDARLQVRQDGKLISGPRHLDHGATSHLSAVGRRWSVTTSANHQPSLALPAAVMLTGAALALLVALMLRQSFTRERYALTMVDARMSERDAAQHELEGARATAQRLATEQTALRRVATSIAAEEPLDTTRATILTELIGLYDADDAAVVRHRHGRLISPSQPDWLADGSDPSIVRCEIRIGRSTLGTVALLNPTAREGMGERMREFGELNAVAVANSETRQELALRASTDGLTGLLNRRTFDERLEGEVSRAIRHGRPLSLAIVDIDHFKRVNDRHGHLAGDAVLIAVAEQLQGLARLGDTIARIGGEEFAWIMPETEALVAFDVAERVRLAVDAAVHGETLDLTISVGIAQLDGARTGDALYMRADAALYDAKRRGRNRIVHHERVEASSSTTLT